MRDWNTVATFRGEGFERGIQTLSRLGPVARTLYFNVVVMRIEAVTATLEEVRDWINAAPHRFDFLGRLVPLTTVFHFGTPEEFEAQARQAVLGWTAALAGRSFHVRMHRRGFKGTLSSLKEEQFLDQTISETLQENGKPARVSFERPEVIIAVETVDQRGGLSLWTRDDLVRYPFLRLD